MPIGIEIVYILCYIFWSMEKLLRPKDRILLVLNFLTDLRYEIFPPLSDTLKAINNAFPPDYKRPSFYSAFYRSLNTGEIKKIVKEGKIYYQLTGLGKKKLTRKFPLLKLQKKKWDGWWRVVIFDIPEKESGLRKALVIKLKSLGFGMWQKSVYISPFKVAVDIRQFLVIHRLRDQACVLVAKDIYAGDVKKLVAKIWSLEVINKQYENLIENWEWVKSPAKGLSASGLKKEARKCYSKYLEIISQDPFLPKDLLPANWWAEEVKALVQEWAEYFD